MPSNCVSDRALGMMEKAADRHAAGMITGFGVLREGR